MKKYSKKIESAIIKQTGLKGAEAMEYYKDAKRWINAIDSGRMICFIVSVSKFGTSRKMKFLECSQPKGGKHYFYFNFIWFLRKSGESIKDDCVNVSSCGMDMVFAVNRDIIRKLEKIGIISKEESDKLSQKTPTAIY